MTIEKLFVPELISKNTTARRAEAQRRLDVMHYSAKNVARLTAYLATSNKRPSTSAKVTATKAVVGSGLELTDEQKTQRDAIFAATGGGAEYHAQCADAGILTKRNALG